MMDAVPSPPRAHGNNYSSVGYAPSHPVPSAEALQHAADILNSGEKVAVLSGAGALHATDEVIEFCELLGAGVANSLLGTASVPDALPYVTGPLGLLGTTRKTALYG